MIGASATDCLGKHADPDDRLALVDAGRQPDALVVVAGVSRSR